MKATLNQKSRLLKDVIRFGFTDPNTPEAEVIWTWTNTLSSNQAGELINSLVKATGEEAILYLKGYSFPFDQLKGRSLIS